MESTTDVKGSQVSETLAAVSAKITDSRSSGRLEQLLPRRTTPEVRKATGSAKRKAHAPSRPKKAFKTKADLVEAMLRRKSGATLDQIGSATDWQPHTSRAFLSGLRKKGRPIVRAKNKAGKSIYRIDAAKAAGMAE